MKIAHYLLVLLPLLLPVALTQGQPASAQSVSRQFRIADDHLGPIRASTTAADLRRIFGPSHVVDKQLPGAEGETIEGSVLYPDSPDRLDVFWTDKTPPHVSGVRISTRGGNWRTAVGHIGVGTSVTDLVERNKRKPLRFSGFDWDYGGIISDWGGGPLAKTFGGKHHIVLQLGYSPAQAAKLTPAEMQSIEGEKQISSTTPAVQKLKPYVDQITVGF